LGDGQAEGSRRFQSYDQLEKEAVELHLAGEDLATMGSAPDPTILVKLELVPALFHTSLMQPDLP